MIETPISCVLPEIASRHSDGRRRSSRSTDLNTDAYNSDWRSSWVSGRIYTCRFLPNTRETRDCACFSMELDSWNNHQSLRKNSAVRSFIDQSKWLTHHRIELRSNRNGIDRSTAETLHGITFLSPTIGAEKDPSTKEFTFRRGLIQYLSRHHNVQSITHPRPYRTESSWANTITPTTKRYFSSSYSSLITRK